MSATQVPALTATDEDIVYWRLEQLLLAGYNCEQAYELAARRDIDLHLALRLLRDGCPSELVLAILL
jgi:hypothetical protein